MINLLPPDMKSQIAAARTNRLLLQYNLLMLAALGFLLTSIIFVYFYLASAKASAAATVAENQSKASDYSSVEASANEFKRNLAVAKTILDGDVTYSKVILKIANLLPSGVVLDNLNLNSASFGTPMVLSAKVKDPATAIAMMNALQASDLFTNVSIQNMGPGDKDKYALSVMYSVTIKKDAAR